MKSADTIFYHGVIAAVEPDLHYYEAVAVTDGKIAAVGTEAQVMLWKGDDTELIDLQGSLVLPGMHDAHLHAADFIHNMDHLACDHMDTLAQLKAAIADRLGTLKGGWLLGNGLPQELLDKGLTRRDLDEAAPHVPVVLIMWHGHGCVANTAALNRSRIGADTPNPPGGIIRREPDGQPNGVLEEASALQSVFACMRSFTPEEIAVKLEAMQHIMNRMGYTSYTESTAGPANNMREGGASGENCLTAYVKLANEGKLTCRVHVGFYSGRNGVQSYDSLKEDLDGGKIPTSPDEDMLTFHMLKFFCDGVETSRTAWMKQAYATEPGNCGCSCFGTAGLTEAERIAELRKTLRLAHDRGYQIGIHTVGDRAVHEALEAIIQAQTENPQADLRHCLIHADDFGDPADLCRCPQYDVVVSSQPSLAAGMFLRGRDLFDEALNQRVMPLRLLLDHGVVLAGGSDNIAGDFHDWREGIVSAVTRIAADGKPYHPEYCITVPEAVRMFTISGAYQEMCEDRRGSIACGKLADFTIVDRNIFEIPPEDIRQVQVLRTVVGGKTVYQA